MSDHYYNRNGVERYTNENGKPTRITDARKRGWVPSSTTVLKMFRKEGLERHIQNSQMIAAAENPFDPNGKMTMWQWQGFVRELASKKGKDAAALGTIYHDAVECVLHDDIMIDEAVVIPPEFFVEFRKWWESTGLVMLETECAFAHSLGYGGKIDLIAEHADTGSIVYVDWKTQDTKPGKDVGFYDAWELP